MDRLYGTVPTAAEWQAFANELLNDPEYQRLEDERERAMFAERDAILATDLDDIDGWKRIDELHRVLQDAVMAVYDYLNPGERERRAARYGL